jgi:hypothetical protein
MMNRLLAIIVISTAGWLHAADLAYPDFTSALKAADAATTFQTAEPIYASLPNYPMRCSDAQVALEWSGKVKFDPASDMQMQVSSRRAEYVSKALAHSTTADCQEFISKNLKKETRFLMPVVAQMAMMFSLS